MIENIGDNKRDETVEISFFICGMKYKHSVQSDIVSTTLQKYKRYDIHTWQGCGSYV